MRFVLVCLAVLTLGFSHGAFAQAPKEVIVVDGQVAVNNVPDVWVQGATNPIPVIDVTPSGKQPWFEFAVSAATTNSLKFSNHSPPTGKIGEIRGLTIQTNVNADIDQADCFAEIYDANDTRSFVLVHLPTYRIPRNNILVVNAFFEFSGLPPISKFTAYCEVRRPNGAILMSSPLIVSWYGTLIDAPSQ